LGAVAQTDYTGSLDCLQRRLAEIQHAKILFTFKT